MTVVLLLQMKLHGQSLESLYKDVPMRLLPVEYLPDDYKGPNAGTEKEIIGNNSKNILYHTIIHPTHSLRILYTASGLLLSPHALYSICPSARPFVRLSSKDST